MTMTNSKETNFGKIHREELIRIMELACEDNKFFADRDNVAKVLDHISALITNKSASANETAFAYFAGARVYSAIGHDVAAKELRQKGFHVLEILENITEPDEDYDGVLTMCAIRFGSLLRKGCYNEAFEMGEKTEKIGGMIGDKRDGLTRELFRTIGKCMQDEVAYRKAMIL